MAQNPKSIVKKTFSKKHNFSSKQSYAHAVCPVQKTSARNRNFYAQSPNTIKKLYIFWTICFSSGQPECIFQSSAKRNTTNSFIIFHSRSEINRRKFGVFDLKAQGMQFSKRSQKLRQKPKFFRSNSENKYKTTRFPKIYHHSRKTRLTRTLDVWQPCWQNLAENLKNFRLEKWYEITKRFRHFFHH